MTIHEVGSHIGGMADDVLTRMRPATNLLVGAARVSSSYVESLLRSDFVADDDVAGPTDDVVIVPKALTRC